MASNYDAIHDDNKSQLETQVSELIESIVVPLYGDRTHFILELLQNAEDALARRADWNGSRCVEFELLEDRLLVHHFGAPFDEGDVRGVCGILKGTKADQLTAIGKFGIGFKSVYAFTKRPEIHSGDEDFAIEDMLRPVSSPAFVCDKDETVIIIPLKAPTQENQSEIASRLHQLKPELLLFLRQIDEIRWSINGEMAGRFYRESTESEDWVHYISIKRETENEAKEDDANWLIFSRAVKTSDGREIGYVELAFSLAPRKDTNKKKIARLKQSPLVVFFPTILETHVGFLVQGPYRTTPSRENLAAGDSLNKRLINETVILLGDMLSWLRENALLTAEALQSLPINALLSNDTNMLEPLYAATKELFLTESILPRFDSGYMTAQVARIARSSELRDLLSPQQLAALFAHDSELVWLSGDISSNRTPALYDYLTKVLGVAELTPELVVRKLDKKFLEAQTDSWINDLYEFLNKKWALRKYLSDLPIIRLEDGSHVLARSGEQPRAFLPGKIKTDFPTIRASVCSTEQSREFLEWLDFTEPDVVDDVVRNLLPRYSSKDINLTKIEYESDISRILAAYRTDSTSQRTKLRLALKKAHFVMAVDPGDGSTHAAKPGEVYIATQRLKDLFDGVRNLSLVDDSHSCLKGDEIRTLLEACGSGRYLQCIKKITHLSSTKRADLRQQAGFAASSGEEKVEDFSLRGLDQLLEVMPTLSADVAAKKAGLLWEALRDLEARGGIGKFSGVYSWQFTQRRTQSFKAAFVGVLNEVSWVPDTNGKLRQPQFIEFDALNWEPSDFLQSQILFQKSVIRALASEAGIELGVLEELQRRGVTTVAELVAILGEEDQPKSGASSEADHVEDAGSKPHGEKLESTARPSDPLSAEPLSVGGEGSHGEGDKHRSIGVGRREAAVLGNGHRSRMGESGAGKTGSKSTSLEAKGRQFFSYVGVQHDEVESDPDGLEHAARMDLEKKAIAIIIGQEPSLLGTPPNNPGFDLYEPDVDGRPLKWIEVKAMTGNLKDRPVGLSRTQFDCAREHGDKYWLYVVEHAADKNARIICIQDPVGKARTFTFDHGWCEIAEIKGDLD